MKQVLLAAILFFTSLTAQSATWRELAETRPEGRVTQQATPCFLNKTDKEVYFCVAFYLDAQAFVAIIVAPHIDAEILTILTTPSPEYPSGYVNPQDLINNVGSSI